MSTAMSSFTPLQDTLMHGAVSLSDYLIGERPEQALGTEIFGSCARLEVHGRSDLDFIVRVDEETYHEWLKLSERRNIERLDFREARKHAAVDVLDVFYSTLGDICGGVASARLNILLLPVNWRNRRLHELKRILAHDDPMFMQNIKRDALVYDSKGGYFTRAW